MKSLSHTAGALAMTIRRTRNSCPTQPPATACAKDIASGPLNTQYWNLLPLHIERRTMGGRIQLEAV